jgi:hypothetical protein
MQGRVCPDLADAHVSAEEQMRKQAWQVAGRRALVGFTAVALSGAFAAGCGGEPLSTATVEVVFDNGKGDVKNMPCPVPWNGEATEVGDLSAGRFEREGNVQITAGRGLFKYGVFKWSKCEDMTTDFYRLKVTENRSALRARVIGEGNLRIVVWQERDGQLVPIEDHAQVLTAESELDASTADLENATFRYELPAGTFIIAVVRHHVAWWNVQTGINNTFYKLVLMKGAVAGQCAQPTLPQRFVIEETTQWDKFLSSFQYTYPEFNILSYATAGEQPTFFGKIRQQMWNYNIGGTRFANRVIGWWTDAGDTVLFTRENTDESIVTNKIDVLDCHDPAQTLGSLGEEAPTGSAYTKYYVYDANGARVAISEKTSEKLPHTGKVGTIFRLRDPKNEDSVLVQISQVDRYEADKWLVERFDAGMNLDPRLFVTIAASYTAAKNQGQRECTEKSEDARSDGGLSADDCSDCCIDEAAETHTLKSTYYTTGGDCYEWDEDNNCTGRTPTVYHDYDLCHCH